MATITSLQTSLIDALDYEATGSVAKAKLVVTYTSQLLVLRPTSASHAGSSTTFDVNQLKELRSEARAFINASQAGSHVRFLIVNRDFGR